MYRNFENFGRSYCGGATDRICINKKHNSIADILSYSLCIAAVDRCDMPAFGHSGRQQYHQKGINHRYRYHAWAYFHG